MSEVFKEGVITTVKPGCDIVSSMAEAFKAEIKGILGGGTEQLIIDLEGVRMMDSMGIGLLIAIHNSLQKKKARLQLINVGADLLKLLKSMRLDRHFQIH